MIGRLSRWAAATVAALSTAGAAADDAAFEALAESYVEELLDMNPELATELGDHRYDGRLNDYTLEGVRNNLERERRFRDRLAALDADGLGDVNAIDYEILRSRIDASIFAMEELREHEWNPLHYNVGGAVYALLARNFAPLDQRLRNVAARLRAVPGVLDAARANLRRPPKVHTETAILQNEGTISLFGPCWMHWPRTGRRTRRSSSRPGRISRKSRASCASGASSACPTSRSRSS